MLSLIFIIFGVSCNALNDTLTHHWYKFRWKDKVEEQWWNPEKSWVNKYQSDYPVQLTDAWHLFKTFRIVFYMFAIVTYQPIVNMLLDVFIFGLVRNAVFSLLYNKLLIKTDGKDNN